MKFKERITEHIDHVVRFKVQANGRATDMNMICEALAYYEDAEEEGRLVVLPCKVGDTVWKTKAVFSNYESPVPEDVVGFAYPWHDPRGDCLLICCKGGKKFDDSQIGDTVFLTREEAEAALAKEKNDG